MPVYYKHRENPDTKLATNDVYDQKNNVIVGNPIGRSYNISYN